MKILMWGILPLLLLLICYYLTISFLPLAVVIVHVMVTAVRSFLESAKDCICIWFSWASNLWCRVDACLKLSIAAWFHESCSETDYFSCLILISLLFPLPSVLLSDTHFLSEKNCRLLLKSSSISPCCNKTSRKNMDQRKDRISYMNHYHGKGNLRFVVPPLPQPQRHIAINHNALMMQKIKFLFQVLCVISCLLMGRLIR